MGEAGFKRNQDEGGNSRRQDGNNPSMPGPETRKSGSKHYSGQPETPMGHRLDDSVGNWVYLELTTGDQMAGKICGLDKEVASLLPYQNFSPVEGGKELKHYVEHEGDPLSVNRGMIKFSKGYSEQEAQNFCDYANRNVYLSKLRREAEINELEQKLDNKDKRDDSESQ